MFQSGGSTDNSASYKLATVDSQRDTLSHWKQTNGFTASAPTPPGQFCAAPNSGEACGLYFNNGDLKFGRDMHCRVKDSSGATACYVSNFGSAGQDDAPTALLAAETYENSGQLTGTPTATVAMEYDPNPSHKLFDVQFWAYGNDPAGTYIAKAALDNQGAKPIPDICLACHQGSYTPTNPTTDSTTVVQGAAFLPFDLDSFLDDQGKLFPISVGTFVPAQQPSFHALNNIIAGIPGPGIATTRAIAELVQPAVPPPTFWYSSTATGTPFTFNQGALQLPGTPFAGHEPLYDSTVKVVCRTCHVAIPDSQGALQWDKFR